VLLAPLEAVYQNGELVGHNWREHVAHTGSDFIFSVCFRALAINCFGVDFGKSDRGNFLGDGILIKLERFWGSKGTFGLKTRDI
jgi:hypothetical protein